MANISRCGAAMKSNRTIFLILLAGFVLFVASVSQLRQMPRVQARVEMQVALPLFVQVAMAAGDRYLAANLAAVRSIIADNFAMDSDQYAVLAKVQEDVSWFNPGHEDNYYVAAAVLPWNDQLDAAQRILARAGDARPYDYQPAFYYAFHLLHFKNDAVGASDWLRKAAAHMPEGDERLQMQNLAAIWLDRANDLDLAIGVVEAMADQSQRKDFGNYLKQRVDRLRVLKEVRRAAETYRQRYGEPVRELSDLVKARLLPSVPVDPFGFGFRITKRGEVVLLNSKLRRGPDQ